MTDSEGSGYGRISQAPLEDTALTHVEAGTPMGELMRRYWQPVALSAELTDLPKRVCILAEDLVVFRDKQGRVGVLGVHCSHRGTSLEYGRIEQQGLRCCYHGWLYDTEGHCLDQPGEPPQSVFKAEIRHPWYPVEERHGLVFAYMGPPDKKPLLPYFEILEGEGTEVIAYRNNSRGVIAECNWLQIQENAMDPVHTYFLHAYNAELHFTDAYDALPEYDFAETPSSVYYRRAVELPNSNTFIRFQELVVPNLRAGAPAHVASDKPIAEGACFIGWWVPVDSTHSIGFHAEALPAVGREARAAAIAATPPGVSSSTIPARQSYEDTQRNPDDREASVSQRPIAIHALEHVGKSDTGIVMWRRLLKRAIKAMENGQDPPGLVRDPARRVVKVASANFIVPPDAEVPRQARASMHALVGTFT